jgi:hypothetical protein
MYGPTGSTHYQHVLPDRVSNLLFIKKICGWGIQVGEFDWQMIDSHWSRMVMMPSTRIFLGELINYRKIEKHKWSNVFSEHVTPYLLENLRDTKFPSFFNSCLNQLELFSYHESGNLDHYIITRILSREKVPVSTNPKFVSRTNVFPLLIDSVFFTSGFGISDFSQSL